MLNKREAMELAAKLAAYGVCLYGPKIAVIRDEAEEKTRGGIIIPDQAKTKPIRGRVVVIGAGLDPSDPGDMVAGLAVGDRVTFVKYNPTLIEVDLPTDTVQVEILHASDIYIGWRD